MKPLRLTVLDRIGRHGLRTNTRTFSLTPAVLASNRVLDSIRTPPTFHDYLRLCSTNNTLLLTLFTTSACVPCRTITPLLTSLIQSRTAKAQDKFSSLAFTEVELDSPDTSNGPMTDLGVMWGVNSIPTLIGFGGRRADIVTERLHDTKIMADKTRMEEWVDEQMKKGDQFPSGGESKGILSRIFG